MIFTVGVDEQYKYPKKSRKIVFIKLATITTQSIQNMLAWTNFTENLNKGKVFVDGRT